MSRLKVVVMLVAVIRWWTYLNFAIIFYQQIIVRVLNIIFNLWVFGYYIIIYLEIAVFLKVTYHHMTFLPERWTDTGAARWGVSDRRSCWRVQRSDLVAGEAGSTRNGPVEGCSADFYSRAEIISRQAVRFILPCRLFVRVSLLCCFASFWLWMF